jgi:hypothetical protein
MTPQLPAIPDAQAGASDLGDREHPWNTQKESLDDFLMECQGLANLKPCTPQRGSQARLALREGHHTLG